MKIIHLSYSDGDGGAGVAARRLHEYLDLYTEIDSELYVISKTTFSPAIYRISENRCKIIINKILNRISQSIIKLDNFFEGYDAFHYRSLNIFKSDTISKINAMEPDIIHLHWINGEMLPIGQLKNLKCKSIFYTLHDSWPFLGTLHHPINCNTLSSVQELVVNKDSLNINSFLDKYIINKKIESYSVVEPTFIAPSKWMKDVANISDIGKNYKCEVIPNLIPPAIFEIEKSKNFDSNSIRVGLGAVNAFSNENKGFNDLLHILKSIPCTNLTFVIFGESTVSSQLLDFYEKGMVEVCGKLESDVDIGNFMRSCDFFLTLSRVESFGLTACEAIANGTPVISYRTSGLTDIVVDGVSGYVAEDLDDMLDKIEHLSNITINEYNKISYSSKKHFIDNFSPSDVVDKHRTIYKKAYNK